MQLFQWVPGRQNGTYEKMALWVGSRFDAYLIRYGTGSHIQPHTDPVANRNHYRLNLILTTPQEGGEFRCKDPIFETKRIKLFRPDRSEHAVTPVRKGGRVVLSIGWAI